MLEVTLGKYGVVIEYATKGHSIQYPISILVANTTVDAIKKIINNHKIKITKQQTLNKNEIFIDVNKDLTYNCLVAIDKMITKKEGL